MHVTIDKWSYYPKCLCLRISNYLSLRWWRRWHVGVYLIGCFVTCGSVFHIWVRMVQKKKVYSWSWSLNSLILLTLQSLQATLFEKNLKYPYHNITFITCEFWFFFSIHIFVPYLPNFYESLKVTNVSTFKV